MSRFRQLVVAFWIFIGIMLLWQFYTYNQAMNKPPDHPAQTQFFFIHSTADSAAAPAQPVRDGAYVEQTGYTVKNDDPAPGSFTVYVTLKNTGNAKAVGVQIHVRPFRGMRLGDEDAGNSQLRIVDDNDPVARIGDWVSFPDMAPGESSTQTTTFLNTPGATPVIPGVTPTGVPGQPTQKLVPQIVFDTEKTKPAATASPH
jgi:hypothetical protein